MAVQGMNGLGRFMGDTFQVRLPYDATNEQKPDDASFAEEAQRWLDTMDVEGDLGTLHAGIVEWILRLKTR